MLARTEATIGHVQVSIPFVTRRREEVPSMVTRPFRTRVKAAAIAVCGIAAIAAAALACGDGGARLIGLRWAAWGSSSAFVGGVFDLNDCTPTCKTGRFLKFPMLAALWRAESLPGHAGRRYYTRLTVIYTGNRAYRARGGIHHLPATVTYPLSQFGGA
jgi:hypothetical protein